MEQGPSCSPQELEGGRKTEAVAEDESVGIEGEMDTLFGPDPEFAVAGAKVVAGRHQHVLCEDYLVPVLPCTPVCP